MSLSIMLFWEVALSVLEVGLSTLFGGGSGIITDPSILISFSGCDESFIGGRWS